MKIIVISGTPGTGKTTISKKISELINAKIFSLNELAVSKNFTLHYDEKRKTYVVDFDHLTPYLIDLIESVKKENLKYLIVEGHFADILPEKYIDFAIVLRCHPDELKKRLQERDYSDNKILENLQSEILGNCANYFLQKQLKKPIFEIETTNLTIESIAKIITDIISENLISTNYDIGKIDWLEILFQEERLKEFFD